jgi:hypothetical protein
VSVPETFTITVTNMGPDEAHNVAVSDEGGFFLDVTALAPAGVSCAAPPPNGLGATTCTIPSLGPEAAMTIKIAGKFFFFHNQCVESNQATATSATHDPNLNNNTATAIIRSNQLQCH